MKEALAGTYSIAAFDPQTKEWGIAVESKFVAIGAVTPWAKAGVGAIATQCKIQTTFGPRGLKLLEQGKSAQETLDILIGEDDEKDWRQVGVVDARGNAATYTGASCPPWAGGVTGENYAIQGNILVSRATIEAMEKTFLATEGDTLAERLLAALAAGQAAGGDSRGKQSAALLVVQEAGGYYSYDDRKFDLRVDEHERPITELKRIYAIYAEFSSAWRKKS